MNYTPEQLSAINTRDRSLLVSAAAGAGKTATLTKRIISALLDPEKPEDISHMLIVTFTNAAVGELKERIGKAIEDALRLDPENRSLERQLMLLPTASISTIDAFCNSILKKNGDKVGAPTNYRIADTAEFELLSHSIMRGLINSLYEGDLPELATGDDFAALADALTSSKRNDDLEEILLHLYNKSKSAPEGVGIFSKLTEEYLTKAPLEGRFVQYALAYVHKMAEHYAERLSLAARSLEGGDERELAYAAIFAADAEYARAILSAKCYDEVREVLLNSNFKSLPGFRSYEKPAAVISGIELRERFKKHALGAFEKFFFYSREEWEALYPGLYSALSLLSRVLVAFDRAYTEEKNRRGMLEYSDIERYAYLALYEGGKPSDVALAIREDYSSIYIDEYQDVNALQGMIFDVISKPDNRFMVGDIKQSIYGFRSADPDIFASMKKSFPPLSESSPGGAASIFMSDNFRCDKGIIDFVNRIFDKIFGAVGESIGYVPEDRLGFAKVYTDTEPPKERPAEFILVSGLSNARQTAEEDRDGQDDDRNAGIRKEECALVAQKIKEILECGKLNDGSRPRPGDIAIIVRRNKKRLADYAAALDELGIPSVKREDKEFFLNAEVLLALSLLNTIDNPKKDIYLAGLLLSPIYKFTPDELYFIRQAGGKALYDSLLLYAEKNPDWEKGRRFLSELERFRLLAEGMPTDSLILRLYKDTGLLELSETRAAREHLFLLYDYAKRFSSSSYHGLYNFIRFINNVIENGATLDSASHSSDGNAVNIITVHASKGLEYPIVFYADTDAIFYDGDAKERIAYSEKFGLSLCLREKDSMALIDNPIQKAVRHYAYRSYVEEEFRISYVALTRAREQLFVVGCIPADADKYLEKVAFEGENLSSFSVYDFKCALDFMLACAKDTSLVTVHAANIDRADAEDGEADFTANQPKSNPSFDDTGIDAKLLASRFSFRYPTEHLSRVPEKLSVSRLYPTVLDGSEDEVLDISIDKSDDVIREKLKLPDFFTGTASDESAKRGTATHLFMQFFDPESLVKLGARGELTRLYEKGFISKEDMERVRINEIEAFIKSDFFLEMQGAVELYRELRFNTRLSARHLTRNEELLSRLGDEEILVQGVMDCVYRDKYGSYHLVDYKTDRLTKEELANKELASKKLNEKHALQLSYYSLAAEKIFGKAPETVRIYSLPLGDTVNLDKFPN